MVEQIFVSPKLKQTVIISNKHGMCELPNDLPNDVRRKILILGNIRKISKLHKIIA